MDDAVIKYYRYLLKTNFEHAGSLDDASIVLDAIGERAINCGEIDAFMKLYVRIADNRIEDIKYQCSCEPITNVAVEILCVLMKGKSLDEAATLTEESFSRFLESENEELRIRGKALLEFVMRGIERYRVEGSPHGRQETP
ncbi:MAG TPA: iron-sulfur cluster assembly scaffold protein [Syntrophales bacterium]|nr:iron-sulfur cluster assembly scaffold protein [Syntrophales bacterium]